MRNSGGAASFHGENGCSVPKLELYFTFHVIVPIDFLFVVTTAS